MKNTTSARCIAPIHRSIPDSTDRRRSKCAAFVSPRRCQIRMSLSMYARMSGPMVTRKAALERPPRAANRRLGPFRSMPGAERLRPDVACPLLAHLPRVLLDGLFEELPLRNPESPRDPIQLVDRRFI